MNIESPRRRTFGSFLYIPFILAALSLLACGNEKSTAAEGGEAATQAATQAQPPTEVVVAQAVRGDLPLELTYTASTRGSREVEVRARVSGILFSRHFQEGAFVKEGALLFKIDPAPFKAAAAAAQGALEVEKARLARTEREKERIVPLFEKNGVSARERDDAVSEWEIAKASVLAAEARFRQAALDLSYTDVRAPISGFTSKETRSEGSLVQAGSESSLLTRIVRLDPLYIEFSMPDEEVRLLRQIRGNELGVPLTLLPEGGQALPQQATLDFLDSAVDSASATVRARASVANPDAVLLPGQFLRVRLEGLALHDVVIVPSRCLVQGATSPSVWVVADDGSVTQTEVRTSARHGDDVVVAEGLVGGEKVITQGLQKIFPGVTVKAVTAAGGQE